MRLISRFGVATVLIGATTCLTLRASEPDAPFKVNFKVRPKSKNFLVHTREVVQKTPALSIRDGNTTVVPSRAGFVYRLERAERDQFLISLPSQGLHGWVPRDSVIEHNQAEAYFTSELDLQPDSSFAHLMRAIVCQDNNRLDQSFADLDQAIRLDPSNVSAWIERAFLWQFRNRMDRAMADVNQAIRVDPRSSEAFVERGVFHYCLKEPRDAWNDLVHAAVLGSRSISVPMTKGMILLEQKKLKEAEAEFGRALGIDPNSADAYLSIGSIQLMSSQRTEAVASFSRAIQADPEKGPAYSGRAAAYLALNEHKQAVHDLNDAIRLDPKLSENFRNRGVVFSYLGEWHQALTDLETALSIEPSDLEAHLARAWMLATCPEASLRDGKKAVASATRACELTEWKAARPLTALAASYAESGDYASAVRWQQKAIDLTSDDHPEKRSYRTYLDRYRSRKPCHRLGLLEEWGFHRGPAAPNASGSAPRPTQSGPGGPDK